MKNNFFIALVGTIILAIIFPKFGVFLNNLVFVSTLCICFMYVGLGITCDITSLTKSFKKAKMHIFTQTFMFIIAPLAGLVIYLIASQFIGYNKSISFFVIACLPTTMTSCIMLTKKYDGDYVSALYNGILAQILAIIMTPLLISIFLKVSFNIILPLNEILTSLICTIIIPFIIGLFFSKFKNKIGKISSVISFYGIFVLLFMNFSALITQEEITFQIYEVLQLILFTFILALFIMTLVIYLSKLFSFNLEERICLIFTGTQKTLGMGIPMALIFFANSIETLLRVQISLISYYIITMVLTVLGVAFVKKTTN